MKSRIRSVLVVLTLALAGCASQASLLGMATGNSQLSQFMTMAQAAGLGGMLEGNNPLTIFAPNNAAFKALGQGKIDDLMKPENKGMLKNILSNHIVAGSLSSSDLKSGVLAANELGKRLNVSQADGVIKVGGATVIGKDQKAKNGYIHIIDKVIVPS